jgi:serine/threonine-protein kinase
VLDGRYRIVKALAEGAMGAVYRGERVGLGRDVAIKVMHDVLPGELSARERFEREAQLMAKLAHPHCVSVIDFGLHENKPYLVMEFVKGKSLHELLLEEHALPARRACDIARQILAGLAHAHELDIIHRDIKPANVMVSPKEGLGDHVQILDFGLARLREQSTQLTAGIAVGTPSYMAPEQCRGAPADARVDLYACGIVLFEMIAGSKPFVARDPLDIVKLHLTAKPPRLADMLPGDHGALEDVIARALAKDPRERYQSAVEMANAIEEAQPDARASSQPRPATSQPEIPLIGSSAILAVDDAPAPEASDAQTKRLPSTPAPAPAPAPARPATPVPTRPPTPVPTRPSTPRAVPPEAMLEPSSARPPARSQGVPLDPHEASMLRRMLPASRMKWVALFLLILVVGGFYGIVRLKQYLSDQAAEQKAPDKAPEKPPSKPAAKATRSR